MTRDRDGGKLPTTGPGAGVPLTRHERRSLDFTETTVVHARWCKAAAYKYGVRDWLAVYDRRLTVSEVESLMAERSTTAEGGPSLRRTPRAEAGLPERGRRG